MLSAEDEGSPCSMCCSSEQPKEKVRVRKRRVLKSEHPGLLIEETGMMPMRALAKTLSEANGVKASSEVIDLSA